MSKGWKYTLSKKHPRYYLVIILPNVGWFSKFFNRLIQQWIFNKILVKFFTTSHIMLLHYRVKCKKSKIVKFWYISHKNMSLLANFTKPQNKTCVCIICSQIKYSESHPLSFTWTRTRDVWAIRLLRYWWSSTCAAQDRACHDIMLVCSRYKLFRRRPAAEVLCKFCSSLDSDLSVGGTGLMKQTRVTPISESWNCFAGRWRTRNRSCTYDRQLLLNQKHVAVIQTMWITISIK